MERSGVVTAPPGTLRTSKLVAEQDFIGGCFGLARYVSFCSKSHVHFFKQEHNTTNRYHFAFVRLRVSARSQISDPRQHNFHQAGVSYSLSK